MSSDTLLKIVYIHVVVNYLELCTKDTNGCVVSLNAEQCEHYAKSSSTSATWNRVFITPTTAGRDNYPKGCFHNFNNQIYFNPHVTGDIKKDTTPICEVCVVSTGMNFETLLFELEHDTIEFFQSKCDIHKKIYSRTCKAVTLKGIVWRWFTTFQNLAEL